MDNVSDILQKPLCSCPAGVVFSFKILYVFPSLAVKGLSTHSLNYLLNTFSSPLFFIFVFFNQTKQIVSTQEKKYST